MKLKMMTPDGLVHDLADAMDVHFDGRQNSGANFHTDLNMVVEHEGPYSVLVHLDDELITQVPFEVRYMRLPAVVGRTGS